MADTLEHSILQDSEHKHTGRAEETVHPESLENVLGLEMTHCASDFVIATQFQLSLQLQTRTKRKMDQDDLSDSKVSFPSKFQ